MWRKVLSLTVLMLAVGMAFLPQPRVAQAQGVAWNAEYFNNAYLLGSAPTFKRTDGAIAFDWGAGSPGQGINTDNFSVRWGGDPYFDAGTYRFWALADDAIRVNVGYAFHPQINTIDSPAVGQLQTVDITLDAGVHHIQVDYQEFGGNAYAYLTWANLATNPTGPNFPISQVSYSTINNGTWTAQYYANTGLTGSPSLIQSENSPSHSWGTGSPVASVPIDNFSARWTSVQTLDAGNYQLSVRADDGVRVYVNGVLTINEWHSATNTTYTVNLSLPGGQNSFQVEYYEAGGEAFIDYSLARVSSVTTGQGGGTVNTGTVAVVTAARLNVRANPSATANILVKINRNENYPVLGKNGDGSWVQINVNGISGWVSSRFVNISGNTNIPVTTNSQALAQPVDTGYDATALATVNVRNIPNTRGSSILTKMTRTTTARIIGRTANNAWWHVNYQGVTGWVSSTYAQIQPDADTDRIPVTG
ncbi:MAG: PA14 domain-containing protein [Anaerolineae bacterium]